PANGATRQAMFTTANEGSVVVQVSAQGVEDTIVDTASISVGTCDAKVHVSGQFAVQAAAGVERDEYELPEDFLPCPPEMPQRPATFWQGRTERVGDAVNAAGTHEFGAGQDIITLHQLATGSGYATYSVDGSGQTSFQVDFEGSDEC